MVNRLNINQQKDCLTDSCFTLSIKQCKNFEFDCLSTQRDLLTKIILLPGQSQLFWQQHTRHLKGVLSLYPFSRFKACIAPNVLCAQNTAVPMSVMF